MNKYCLKSGVTSKELKDFGFEEEYDEDENGKEHLDQYVKTIYSKKIKGAFVPFIALGWFVIEHPSKELFIFENRQIPLAKQEWEKERDTFIELLLEKNIIKEKEDDDNNSW